MVFNLKMEATGEWKVKSRAPNERRKLRTEGWKLTTDHRQATTDNRSSAARGLGAGGEAELRSFQQPPTERIVGVGAHVGVRAAHVRKPQLCAS